VGCREGHWGVESNRVGERRCSQERHLQAHVESEAARWVKKLFGGGVLALMGVVSRLSKGRRSESSESNFCDLRWEEIARE
jgi:hypothetical protein